MSFAWEEIEKHLLKIQGLVEQNEPDWRTAVTRMEELIPGIPHSTLANHPQGTLLPKTDWTIEELDVALTRLERLLKQNDQENALKTISDALVAVSKLKRREKKQNI
jgi:hypothetical protein